MMILISVKLSPQKWFGVCIESVSYTHLPLKIATIFSYAANESQAAIGEIDDESFSPTDIADISSKEFLASCISDYNRLFGTNFTINSKDFQNYYRDLAKRVKNRDVDLLIVVGMFLTGFDAPTLNTLFVDKNLRYHGLIQAFSRTNRIYDCLLYTSCLRPYQHQEYP